MVLQYTVSKEAQQSLFSAVDQNQEAAIFSLYVDYTCKVRKEKVNAWFGNANGIVKPLKFNMDWTQRTERI